MDLLPTLRLNAVKKERSIVSLPRHPIKSNYSEPFLKISSLHVILAYRAVTTLKSFQEKFISLDWIHRS